MTRGPDLVRSCGDGFTVTARYVPSLRAPVLAVVSVSLAGNVLQAVTVPAVDGFTVYSHPAVYLADYREAVMS